MRRSEDGTMKTILRRLCLLVVCCLACTVLFSCGKKPKDQAPDDGTEQEQILAPVESTPTPTSSPSPGADLYPDSRHVTWAYMYALGLSKEKQNEINRILYEKGLDCQIRFIQTDYLGSEYAHWLETYERENGAIDIITTSAWDMKERFVTLEGIHFTENHIVPWNEYLETEEGSALKNLYTDDEWKSVTLDGKIYGVPKAYYSTEIYSGVDDGIYVSVNETYGAYFDGFDGTYASLKKIYGKIGDPELQIVIDELGQEILYGLLGYQTVLGLPYHKDTKSVTNPTRTDEFPDLIREIYSDLSSGILCNRSRGDVPDAPEKVLAHIYRSKSLPEDGFREYRIASPSYQFNCFGKYGVSVNSGQKDLAFQILSVCLSDPEILRLIDWYDALPELIEQRTSLLADNPESELAGLYFTLTEEETDEFGDGLIFVRLENAMYRRKGPGNDNDYEYVLNPDFDFVAAWTEYAAEAGVSDDLLRSINGQIREWVNGGTGRGNKE